MRLPCEEGGDLLGNIDIKGTVGGVLLVYGSTAAGVQVTVGSLAPNAFVGLGWGFLQCHIDDVFAGKFSLNSDIPSGAFVVLNGENASTAVVDLRGNDVHGNLFVRTGGPVQIINGGDVTGVFPFFGVILAAETIDLVVPPVFTGTATFQNVSGLITTYNGGNFDGTIKIIQGVSGSILLDEWQGQFGDLGPNALIEIGGSLSGNVFVDGDAQGRITLKGAVTGGITVGEIVSGNVLIADKLEGGTLTFVGNASSTAYVRVNNMISAGMTHSLVDLQGIFDGDMLLNSGIPVNQEVRIAGALDLHGEIDLDGDDVAGTLSFDGGSGRIIDGGAVTGSVSLGDGDAYSGSASFAGVSFNGDISTTNGADLTGTLYVGDLDGTIGIAGALSARGRILVSGSSSGLVTIEEGTFLDSQITFTGGMDGGQLVINNSAGNHAADGDILLGVTYSPSPLINTDGCILVKVWNTNPPQANSYGELNGDLHIVGCHSADVDFDLCAKINGTVTFIQPGCSTTYAVTHSCQGTCP